MTHLTLLATAPNQRLELGPQGHVALSSKTALEDFHLSVRPQGLCTCYPSAHNALSCHSSDFSSNATSSDMPSLTFPLGIYFITMAELSLSLIYHYLKLCYIFAFLLLYCLSLGV